MTLLQTPEGVLTATEASLIIRMQEKLLQPSTVQLPGGRGQSPMYRSSWQCECKQPQHLVNRVQHAVAHMSRLGIEHQEPPQVLRYRVGERYGIHHDDDGRKNRRLMTFAIGLSGDYEGGELRFPDLGHELRAPLGGIVWWRNDDRRYRHEAKPVTAGEKWVLVIFVRENPVGSGK